MPRVFISYRKTDSLEFCRRMSAELRGYFGDEVVFFDETTALPGMDWPQAIQDALRAANVVLVVIGGRWLQAQDANSGRRRLDVKTDWVRQELIAALERPEGVSHPLVVPVLVGDTPMPTEEDLGDELNNLCHRQALRLPDTGTPYDFRHLQDFLMQRGFHPRALPPVATPRVGKPPKQLSDREEQEFLAELEHWDIVETDEPFMPGSVRRELHRVYEFSSFDLAFQFMSEVVARGVEPHNHHPRWENAFNRVEIWLTTFNLNYRPSQRDVRLAQVCESLWDDFRGPR